MANFLLGFLFAQVVLVFCLASAKRLRRVAGFLEAVADWAAPARCCTVSRKSRRNPSRGTEHQQDVVDALVALRVPRKAATYAAAAAIERLNPDATFDDHFRAAVGIAKESK